MKHAIVAAALAAALAMPAAVSAQAAASSSGQRINPAYQPPTQSEPGRPDAMMPAGTLVQLTPSQEISSKHVDEGDHVVFSVVGDVVEKGAVVIPRGSTVTATVVWKTGRAVGGKSGKFEVRFDSVSVRGHSYAMKGAFRQEGRGNTVGALLGAIVITGRSAVMLPGDLCNGFTDEPIPYNI